MSEKAFWIKAKEEELAEPDILDGLAQKFSSKPAKKTEDVTDRYVYSILKSVVLLFL